MEGRGMSRSKETKAPPETTSEDWALLPWRKLERHVYRLQKCIYPASEGIVDNDHLIEEPDDGKLSRPVL